MSKAAELAALIANVNKGSSLGNKNFIINGAQNVAQRATSSTGLGGSTGYFVTDRNKLVFSTSGRLTMEQVADGPSGFLNATKLSCTTADTSIGAGENFLFSQYFEGQNLQSLKKGTSDAVPITVSFYVKGNASATYGMEIYDLDNTRSISTTFDVTTGWTRVEKTFAGDTTGALDDDNNASLAIFLWLHAGSDSNSGTLNTSWNSVTAANRTDSNNTSFFDSTSRTFFITGWQMEIGEKATEFEHINDFGKELAQCQRYFVKVNDEFASQTNAYPAFPSSRWGSNQQFATVALPVPLRGQATITITSGTGVNFRMNGSSDNKTAVVHLNTEKTGRVTFYGNSLSYDPTGGHAGVMFIHDDSTMQFDAEL